MLTCRTVLRILLFLQIKRSSKHFRKEFVYEEFLRSSQLKNLLQYLKFNNRNTFDKFRHQYSYTMLHKGFLHSYLLPGNFCKCLHKSKAPKNIYMHEKADSDFNHSFNTVC